MRTLISAGLSGLVFGFGLALSGMIDPLKIQAFLDVAGNWDPSLALVLFAAVAVYAAGFRWVLRSPAPWFSEDFHVPSRRDLDSKLIIGAAIFGVGWGLAGYCPGPAVTAVALGNTEILWFLPAMVLGMYSQRWLSAS